LGIYLKGTLRVPLEVVVLWSIGLEDRRRVGLGISQRPKMAQGLALRGLKCMELEEVILLR
jgi:hypothetical protein